jgi:tRNA G18 (ribose-2'-O)-methylase SpoU
MKKNANGRVVSRTMLLLHDIRSVHNVGSIFRTADAFGVSKIYLSGYTPAPLDRFGRMRSDLAKVALGAEKNVPWEALGNELKTVVNFVKKIKKDGVQIVALEQDPRAISPKDAMSIISESSFLLILGREVEGIDSIFLDLADSIVEIPMSGKKESLNVSVAAGIALFALKNI